MKKLILFFTVILLSPALFSQDYKLSFAGTGSSTTVGSVIVENLTQNKSVTLNGNETLHLAATITGINDVDEVKEKLFISPNPIVDEGVATFFAKNEGLVSVEILESSGVLVFQRSYYLYPGKNSLKISELANGIFILNISSKTYSYSGKILSIKRNHIRVNAPVVESLGLGSTVMQQLKSVSAEKYLIFKKGDILKITGKSGDYSTIVGDSPVADKTITFNFMPCIDGDGNNYPVVQVGEQIWMGENLRTTKLNDGTEIPNITKDSDWGALTTRGYCWANNDAANKSPYGGLYNWYAVNTGKLAPKGWHVPTDKELDDFLRNFGGSPSMVYKIQVTGNEYRKTDAFNASNATNETGFSLVPGGMRNGANNAGVGLFAGYKEWGFYWSSTFWGTYSTGDVAHCRSVITSFDNLGMLLKDGLSVRCLKD